MPPAVVYRGGTYVQCRSMLIFLRGCLQELGSFTKLRRRDLLGLGAGQLLLQKA